MEQKLYSLAGFYKNDQPENGGFSFTIDQHADEFAEALDIAYSRFLSLSPERRQEYLNEIPNQLAAIKSHITGHEGQRFTASSQNMLIGLLAIFILEKLKMIPSDEHNGMQYTTLSEVNAYKSILAGGLKPGVSILSYAHEDDCPKLSGGACNCKPDVQVQQWGATA
ncbi:MAG: hypothetical protein WB799_05830 [Candidatus Sulfotelmatobacter sp.]